MRTFKNRYILSCLIFVVLWPSNLLAQKHQTEKSHWEQKIINQYFKENKPENHYDSVFYAAYRYLNYDIEKDTSNIDFGKFIDFLNQNKPAKALAEYHQFLDTVKTGNQLYHNFISEVREKRRLMAIADTAEISSTDSVFGNLTDVIQENINFDSLFSIKPQYPDTLVKAVAENIYDISQNPIFKQIKDLRRDTSYFYLINLNGDSVRLRFYNNNPDMVRIYITDLLGKGEKAIVRDIQKNSFRLLIDQEPEINNSNKDKARQAIGGLYQGALNRVLTIGKRPQPDLSKPWSIWGNSSIDLTQIAVSHWVKGGAETYSILGGTELYAFYKKGLASWENSGKFRYGTLYQYGYGAFRPTEDKIQILSKFGYKAFNKFDYSIICDFKSQFAPGHSYSGSKRGAITSAFFNPAYLTFAAGLDYKPKDYLSLFVSPLTSKNTFVTRDAIDHSLYGVSNDKNIRSETGAIVNIAYKKKNMGKY